MRKCLLASLLALLVVGCTLAEPNRARETKTPTPQTNVDEVGTFPQHAGEHTEAGPAKATFELKEENFRQVHFLRHADSVWQMDGDLVWTGFDGDSNRAYVATTLTEDRYLCPEELGRAKITGIEGNKVHVHTARGRLGSFDLVTHEWISDT